MYQTEFPVGIPTTWQDWDSVTVPDAYLKNWLLDTGSLTERLQSQCRQFSVAVIGQRPIPLDLEELNQLDGKNSNSLKWHVREVMLLGDGRPWVFARSIIPQSLCEGDLAQLGNKPLGKIIFNDSRFSRSGFQLCQVKNPNQWLTGIGVHNRTSLWGRRSVFSFENLKMSVAEVFLPEAPAYRQMRDQT